MDPTRKALISFEKLVTNILLFNIMHQILSKTKFQILAHCVLVFNNNKEKSPTRRPITLYFTQLEQTLRDLKFSQRLLNIPVFRDVTLSILISSPCTRSDYQPSKGGNYLPKAQHPRKLPSSIYTLISRSGDTKLLYSGKQNRSVAKAIRLPDHAPRISSYRNSFARRDFLSSQENPC